MTSGLHNFGISLEDSLLTTEAEVPRAIEEPSDPDRDGDSGEVTLEAPSVLDRLDNEPFETT